LERIDVSDPLAALQQGDGEIGYTAPSHLSFAAELEHRPPAFLDRHAEPKWSFVNLVQIDHIDAQAT
jgi:hypothetical protein